MGEDYSPYLGVSRRLDWGGSRRAERDAARHNEKVKDAIKDHLEDFVSDGSIITADPRSMKKIKVPMKSLELPHFRFGDDNEGIGVGDGSEQPGDALIEGEDYGEPGDQPGEEYYETEIELDEIQRMVFEDLGLPFMEPRGAQDIESEYVRFDDIRHKRTTTNLHITRTAIQNMMRNARETGSATLGGISPEDYRVRSWNHEMKPENSAVVIAMADISGSMGEKEKYITRAFCWWAVNFLRSKYPKVEIVFVAHDTEAYEVTEEQFFTRGAGGGTKCSSANQKALELVSERYPTSDYNVYPLHFSDGDNFSNDNGKCVELVNKLLEDGINQYAYVQIGSRSSSGLIYRYRNEIKNPRMQSVIIDDKEDVLQGLQQVFNPSNENAG